MGKVFCARHERFHEATEPCLYCVPDEPEPVKERDPLRYTPEPAANPWYAWPTVPSWPSKQQSVKETDWGDGDPAMAGWHGCRHVDRWSSDDERAYRAYLKAVTPLRSRQKIQARRSGETYEDWVRRCGINPTVFGGRAVAQLVPPRPLLTKAPADGSPLPLTYASQLTSATAARSAGDVAMRREAAVRALRARRDEPGCDCFNCRHKRGEE